MARIMAGSEYIEGNGVRITSTTIKDHVNFDGSIFRELIAVQIAEQYPGALQTAKLKYAFEPTKTR